MTTTTTNPIGQIADAEAMPSAVFESLPARIRDETLETAREIISVEKEQLYGDAATSFAQIAKIWSIILDTEDQPVSALDVAMCMTAVKLVRQGASPKRLDNYVDLAGYAALGAEIAGAQ